MDTPGSTWKQHLLAVGLRLVWSTAISVAGLIAGGVPERTDGSEQAPGVAGMVFMGGVIAALVFAFVTSMIHFRFRQRPIKSILLVDALLAAAFIAFLAYSSAKVKS